MSKRDKLLQRFRNNPKTVRFEEVDTLLLQFGFTKRQSGSHATYKFGEHLITVPFRKPYILPVYVKNLLEILEAIGESLE
ncbi:MAG: type II toxin-antitoxin system HicA family toxin [Caldilineaceae bacterium]|nr:type II toxin-antitoxin system HicA family toxin [Caldilineaceae bacterium]